MVGPEIAAVIFFRIESSCAHVVYVYLLPVTRGPR
jgi:hypothetical protein